MNKKGELYCYGCGVKLQFTSKDRVGYIAKSAFENTVYPLCQRCYDIKYHNRITDVETIDADYTKLFENIIQSRCLVVYVIDIFNSNIKSVNEMLKKLKNRVILVINKVDILPKSIKNEKIINWMKQLVNNRNIVKYIVTSAAHNFYIDELREEIERHRDGKSVYFVGSTNAGKSSIINMFLKNYQNKTNKMITTSCYANTTLQIVEIPLDKDSYIFDTPGFIDSGNISSVIDSKIMNEILPKKEIKPHVYQITSNQSLYIGGLLRIDVFPINKGSLVIYGSSSIKIHRSKQEKADDIFENLIENKQVYPISNRHLELSRFVVKEFKIDSDKIDLICPGYCIITLRKFNNTTIKVYLPKNVNAELINSLI